MRQRIIDKIFIILMIIATTFLMVEDVMAFHVCEVLVTIIFLGIDEVLSNRLFPIVAAIIVGVCLLINPYATIVVPAVIYVLINRGGMPEYALSLILLLLSLPVQDVGSKRLVVLIVSVVSGYIAYFSAHYCELLDRSTLLFDKARQEAVESTRQRRELSEKADAEVYTARLKERNRIAREIHDNVGHMLTRAVVQMQAVLVINKDDEIKPYLESVNKTINEAMTNIRRSVHELHDDSIDLSIGVNDLAATLKDRFEVEVSTSLDSPVSNEIKQQILGIIKECITNISKHSNGSKVLIEIVENVTFWRIKVFDNGSSDKLELVSSADFAMHEGDSGIGLININSRAHVIGGRTSIMGGPDGFTVMVTIPKEK